MTGRGAALSERLKSLADMVSKGNTVVDVGCDHGYLSIYLVQHGISPGVLAMDVRKGPLSAAQEHIRQYQLEDYIETRLSDGLSQYHIGEVETLVCAGMGGPLMMKILTESGDKAKSMRELILQPQSELPAFRRFLRYGGYRTLDENILCEEGKYYFLFRVFYDRKAPLSEEERQPGSNALCELYDSFGRLLLERRHPVLREYLEDSLRTAVRIENSLRNCGGLRAQERLPQIERKISQIKAALAMF